MTYPVQIGAAIPREIESCVRAMRSRAQQRGREDAMDRVLKVRRGEFALVWPDQFNEQFPTAIVANFVDVAARDLAANLSPLPSLACSAGQMRTDADKRRAEKKNRIGHNYWRHSDLETQMKYGADQYLSYGFLPFWVEADYRNKTPYIHVEDPIGAYYELNRRLETVRYAREWRQSIDELAALFDDYADRILTDQYGRRYEETETRVVRYIDNMQVLIYLPDRNNLVVAQYLHKQVKDGRPVCPVHIALRPGVELDPRGQFDDALWVQLAHTVMAALTLEAGHKAVQAPMILPDDVQEVVIGPDAVMTSNQPEKAQRLPLNVPPAAFALSEQLQQEMKEAVGYPDTRLGTGPAGGSTGRGISALEGGFDTQIKLGQDILGTAIRKVTEMCFRMDATLWPRITKPIQGTLSGESFSITYIPGKDIADTSCEVTYGFASGVSPNSAIVTLLQLRGDDVISRDTFRRQLPFDIDVDAEQRSLDVQSLEQAAMEGVKAGLQATGQMIASGQPQTALTFFDAAVKLIKGRRDGSDMADLIDAVLVQPIQQQMQAQQQQQQEEMAEAQQGAAGPGGPGGAPGGLQGVGANGLPTGVAPGQAGLPPGGRPSIEDLTAGFSQGGSPELNAGIRRRLAIG